MAEDNDKDRQIAYLQGQVDALKGSQATPPPIPPKRGGRFANGCLTVVAVFVALGLVGAIMQATIGKNVSGPGNNVASDELTPPPPDNPPLTKTQAHARDLVEARALYHGIVSTTAECDGDAKYASQSLQDGNRVELYQNAKAAQSNCAQASEQINNLTLPLHASIDVKTQLKAARKELSDAYATKSYFYSQVASAADRGSLRPSQTLEIEKWGQAGAYGSLKGLVDVMAALEHEGVTVNELTGKRRR